MKNQLGTPYEQGRNGMKEDILAKIRSEPYQRELPNYDTALLYILKLIKDLK